MVPSTAGLRDRALSVIRRVPRMSTSGTRLLAALARRDIDGRELVAIVQRDPVLAAHVLQLANSGAFGRLRRVETIPHAVAFLGQSTLRRYAVSWAMSGLFKRLSLPPGWSMTRFSMHAEATAQLVDILCDSIPVDGADAALLAGLVHDIGKFAICAAAPDAIGRILSVRTEGSTATECERQMLGIDHAEISSMAAEQWHLSDDTCRAIHFHHEPERDSSPKGIPLSLVLAKSDRFINGLGLSFLSSSWDATDRLEIPGYDTEVKRALKSFEVVWRASHAPGG